MVGRVTRAAEPEVFALLCKFIAVDDETGFAAVAGCSSDLLVLAAFTVFLEVGERPVGRGDAGIVLLDAAANIGNIIIVLLISSWAIRLGTFLFLRIKKDGEDKRFRTIKPSASRFFMTWTLQGLWVSLCSMCALTAISSESGIILNVFFYLGVAIFILGFAIEIIADNQKSKFRSIEANKDSFITTGLWAKSRHPNYLGEILLWLGVAVISFSSLNGWQYLTLISPIFTYLLLVYVSGVRMLEERGEKKWGHNEEYIKYKSTTPRLFFNLK